MVFVRRDTNPNDEPVDLAAATANGYARVAREWRGGDRVRLDLDLAVENVWAHPEVRQDAGRVALMRGPRLYCLEGVDNPISLNRLRAPEPLRYECRFEPDLLGGVTPLAPAEADATADWTQTLYRTSSVKTELAPIKAVYRTSRGTIGRQAKCSSGFATASPADRRFGRFSAGFTLFSMRQRHSLDEARR